MTIEYRGHDVIDTAQRLIGTIDDVVYTSDGQPQWAVVDLGLLRSSHYLPVATGYLSDDGKFVVPYEKRVVKSAPKADRSHVIGAELERELTEHYSLCN